MFNVDEPRSEHPALVVPSDLVGVAELAEELGVSKQSVANYAAGRARPGTGFPEPIVRLKATPVWSRAAVLEWWDREAPNTRRSR